MTLGRQCMHPGCTAWCWEWRNSQTALSTMHLHPTYSLTFSWQVKSASLVVHPTCLAMHGLSQLLSKSTLQSCACTASCSSVFLLSVGTENQRPSQHVNVLMQVLLCHFAPLGVLPRETHAEYMLLEQQKRTGQDEQTVTSDQP